MSKSNACFVLTISPFQHANKSSIVNCILIKKSICFSKVTFQLIWIPLCLYYFEYALINRIWMFLMKITKKRVLKFKPSKNVKYTKCKDTNNECGIKLLQVTLSSQYLKNPWTWKSCRKLILSVFTKIQSNVTKWDESFFFTIYDVNGFPNQYVNKAMTWKSIAQWAMPLYGHNWFHSSTYCKSRFKNIRPFLQWKLRAQI